MKYISFVVPCFNSEKYMEKCIDSLLMCGDDVEIIIVNDGSTDKTAEIAKNYLKNNSNIKFIDKENGGHGSGINAGLKICEGLYFKCVDSDDWIDFDAYKKLIKVIKDNYNKNTNPDLYLTNYNYERIDMNKSFCEDYLRKLVPHDCIFGWDKVKKMKLHQFLMMHSLIYKTSIIKQSNLNLPEKTFYVDNIFVYKPLYYVKTLYYLDIDFYRYYVGRPGQSISTKNMTDRYQMQLTVMKEIVKSYTYEDLKKLNKHHLKIMIHDLVIKHFLTCFFIYGDYSKEKNNEFHQYFRYFKNVSLSLYRKIMYRSCFTFCRYIFLPIKILATKLIYKKIVRKRNWY